MTKLQVILYYIISFTWGILMTLVGLLVSAVLLICGKRPKRFGMCWYFPVGDGWGCELGTCFLADKNETYSLMCHELGHSLQNIKYGPLTPFIVSIPSVYRFWLREQKGYKSKHTFACIELISVSVLSLVIAGVATYFSLTWLMIVGLLLAVYNTILNHWMFKKELPQYVETPYPKYDDIWFEDDASTGGTKFMEIYYPR